MSSQKLRIFNVISKPFVKLVERYYPDAFIFVIVLSVLTYFLALINTDATAIQTLEAWGNGLPKLFTFTAQICIIMITAHALAHTKPVESFLSKIGFHLSLKGKQQLPKCVLVVFLCGPGSQMGIAAFVWTHRATNPPAHALPPLHH